MIERSADREQLLAAVDVAGAQARSDAAEAERARRLTPALDALLRRQRLYDAFLPKELGGLGVDPITLIELTERMASHDGSAGWCLGTCGMIAGFAASRLSDEGARDVFGSEGGVVVAGGYVPRCAAEPVSGGYRVSGRMPFASGCHHADFFLVTGLVSGQEGFDAVRSFVLPTRDARVLDNWHVAGLEATGSNDLELDGAFVPEARSFAPLIDPPQRGSVHWRAPVLSFASIAHLGFALGAPRLALDEIKNQAARHRYGSAAPIADRGVFRRDYARAHTRLRAARLAALAAFETVMAGCGDATLHDRAELAASVAHAYATAVNVAEFAFRAGGASSLYREGALQRAFRDVQAGAQHVVAADEAFERAGAVFLGVDEPAFL